MQCVIYKADNGNVAVLAPTPEALQHMTIHEIAVKDVPGGKPFAIIDAAGLPDAPQEAWVVDENQLTDGVGGPKP